MGYLNRVINKGRVCRTRHRASNSEVSSLFVSLKRPKEEVVTRIWRKKGLWKGLPVTYG